MAENELPSNVVLRSPEAKAAGIVDRASNMETQNVPVTGALQGPQAQDQQFSLAPGGDIGPAAPVSPAHRGVMDRVANFVTGGQQTPGAMWRGIIGGALTGMVGGAGQRHFGSGVAAGGMAQQAQAQRQFENQQQQQRLQMEQSREDQERQVRSAQIAKTNHDIWESTQRLQMMEVEASARHAHEESTFVRDAMQLSGDAKDLGTFHGENGMLSDAEIQKLQQMHPDWGKDMARGNILTVPHYREETDEKTGLTRQVYDGIHAVYMPPNVGNQKTDHDIDIPKFVAGQKANEAGHWESQTIKAGTMTNQAAFQAWQHAQDELTKYDNNAAIANANAKMAAAQAKLASVAKNQADAQQQVQEANNMARSLVEHDTSPTQLPKRATKGSNTWNAIMDAADAYSMAHYGKHFDAAKSEDDFKEANKYRPTLNFMNTLTGVTGSGGTMDQLLALSDKIPRTDFPSVNDKVAWARLKTGSGPMASYAALAITTAEEVARILQGGSTGSSVTDAKLREAKEMFDKGFSDQQLRDVVATMKESLGLRRDALLQSNDYLNKWYGPDSDLVRRAQASQSRQAQQQGILPGGTASNPMGLEGL